MHNAQWASPGGEAHSLYLATRLQQRRRVEVVALDVLEVAVGRHLQLHAGILVGDDDGMPMHLQGKGSKGDAKIAKIPPRQIIAVAV